MFKVSKISRLSFFRVKFIISASSLHFVLFLFFTVKTVWNIKVSFKLIHMMKKIINYVKLYTLDIILILRNVILSRVIIRPNYNVFKTLNIYMYVQTTNNIVAIAAKELFFFFFFARYAIMRSAKRHKSAAQNFTTPVHRLNYPTDMVTT